MRVAPSPCTLRIPSTPCRQSISACASCAASAYPSPSPTTAAVAAVPLTLWETIATSGFLHARSIPLERAVARICREAGGRVRTNVLLRDMTNLPCPPPDARAIEVLVSGVPLWHGAQIAIDATLVSPIHRNGEPRPRAASEPGVTLNQAARRKRTQTYPEFQSSTRCSLAVFGLEVGGRWSPEAVHLVRHLARARARTEPTWARSTAAAAWALRWAALASIAAMRALAASLLDFPAHGEDAMDGPPPPSPSSSPTPGGRTPPHPAACPLDTV